MKSKYIKWFLPVICYFIIIGLIFVSFEIDEWLFGIRHSDAPLIIPSYFVIPVLYLPYLLLGYFLVWITQLVYKKSKKRAKIFAIIFPVIMLLVMTFCEIYFVGVPQWFFYFIIIIPPVVLYYVVFFVSLFYLLNAESKTKIT